MEPGVTSMVRGFLFMKMNGTPRYTVIMHDVREKYKMTLTEYAIADSIYHLQNNEKHICTASREYLGKFVGISERHAKRVVIDLVSKGLIVKVGPNLTTTTRWNDCYLKKDDNKSPEKGQNVPVERDKMSPNNNTIKTNIYIKDGKKLLDYLNAKTQRKFKVVHTNTINALKIYNIDELKKIIDCKMKEWGNDVKMRKFLRQETLFRASHLDTYLTEAQEDGDKPGAGFSQG